MKKLNIFKKVKILKNLSFSLIIGLTLAAGITFAWNAVWHGTDWVKRGNVIKSKELGETLEYLYMKSRLLPENCNQVGDVLVWNGSGFSCESSERGSGSGNDANNNNNNTTTPELIAGCAVVNNYQALTGTRGLWFPKAPKCWGGASAVSGNGVLADIHCPAGSTKVILGQYETGCDWAGGDGAPYIACEYVTLSLGCVK